MFAGEKKHNVFVIKHMVLDCVPKNIDKTKMFFTLKCQNDVRYQKKQKYKKYERGFANCVSLRVLLFLFVGYVYL